MSQCGQLFQFLSRFVERPSPWFRSAGCIAEKRVREITLSNSARDGQYCSVFLIHNT